MTLAARLRAAVTAAGASSLRGDWDFDIGDTPERKLVPAAVLVPIVRRAEPTLLLTRRSSLLRRHAGQIAFPGGRIDPEDAGPVAAALREAWEEIALPPSEVEVLGIGDDYETGTGYRVTPVLGLLPPDLPLVPFAAEVDAVFEVPLGEALDPARHELREGEWQGRKRQFYVIAAGGHEIWGATAGMIVNLARRLG